MPIKSNRNIKTHQDYKEVVVIGNGPSGITLSYMLSGNTPYYKGTSTDKFLDIRLQQNPEVPLVLQDLEYLSDGLQGRSNNPVSLLFDALAHPDADIGIQKECLMDWRFDPSFSFDHVVLGRESPGGTWASLEGDFLTLSLGSWMELPNLNIKEHLIGKCEVNEERSRVSVSAVAEYYRSYVENMGLADNFMNGVEVTSVTRLRNKDTPGYYTSEEESTDCSDSFESCRRCYLDEYSARDEELERMMSNSSSNCSWDPICNPSLYGSPCHFFGSGQSPSSSLISSSKRDEEKVGTLWKVSGFKMESGRSVPFSFITPNVVLAAGSYDNSNKLNCLGESESESRILRTLRDFERNSKEIKDSGVPVCIVGSGLSAADAILAALEQKVTVIHSFRRQPNDPEFVYSKLPSVIYPEYHRFHKMMKSEISSPYYRPFPSTSVKSTGIKDGSYIQITFSDGRTIEASYLISLIGSSSDLSFLEGYEDLGILPDQPISRNNPIYIDTITHECISHPGLYAMGPLVGDNFVRFIQGGALAISSDLLKQRDRKINKKFL